MDKTVTVTLTQDQLGVVMAGLAELPLKTSLTVFHAIQKAAAEQLQPRADGPWADKVVG